MYKKYIYIYIYIYIIYFLYVYIIYIYLFIYLYFILNIFIKLDISGLATKISKPKCQSPGAMACNQDCASD